LEAGANEFRTGFLIQDSGQGVVAGQSDKCPFAAIKNNGSSISHATAVIFLRAFQTRPLLEIRRPMFHSVNTCAKCRK
jgi:hypothetical protein